MFRQPNPLFMIKGIWRDDGATGRRDDGTTGRRDDGTMGQADDDRKQNSVGTT
jgi:hypothetical protein